MAIAIVFILSVLGGCVLPAVAGADDPPPAACGAAQLPCEPSSENDLLLQITSSPQSESSGGLEGNLGSAPAAHDDDAAVEDELTHEFKEEMDADGSGFMELGEIETLEKDLGVLGGIPWRRYDADRDGKLSESEFVALAKEGAIEDDHNASLLDVAENEEGPQFARTIRWGDQVALSITSHYYKTRNCGWFGCRVAVMNPKNIMQFGHGSALDTPPGRFGQKAGGFFLPPLPGRKWGGCLKWGDQVALSVTRHRGKTGNCGWYGCRVAVMNPQNIMQFGHGSALNAAPGRFGAKAGGFYVRPHPLQRYCARSRKCATVGKIRSCAWRIACSRGAEDGHARVKAKAKATLRASRKAKVKVRAKAIKWAASAPIEEIP